MEEKQNYRTVDVFGKNVNWIELSESDAQKELCPVEDKATSLPTYIKLSPHEQWVVREKIKERCRETFLFRSIIIGIYGIAMASFGYFYGKGDGREQSQIKSIATTSTNITSVVHSDNSTNLFYLYNGQYVPKETIEKMIRTQKEAELEKSLQEERKNIFGK